MMASGVFLTLKEESEAGRSGTFTTRALNGIVALCTLTSKYRLFVVSLRSFDTESSLGSFGGVPVSFYRFSPVLPPLASPLFTGTFLPD